LTHQDNNGKLGILFYIYFWLMDSEIKTELTELKNGVQAVMKFLREYMPTREEVDARFETLPTIND